MARTRKNAVTASKEVPKKVASSAAARRKILGGIGKPHKKSNKEQKTAFRSFLKRLGERDEKLENSKELAMPGQPGEKVKNTTTGIEGEEWEVEEILDSSIINKQLHFLVLWRGHFIEASTWEPEESLENSKGAIDDFFEAFPKKSGAPGVKPRGRGVKSSD